MADKRAAGDLAVVALPAKRAKNELALSSGSGVGNGGGAIVPAGPPRTSNLLAPVMELSGHGDALYASRFNPSGNLFATAGFDRDIFLWTTFGQCDNIMRLQGHTGAVLALAWSRANHNLYSCSTDKTLAVWDGDTGERLRRLKGHTSYVNTCAAPHTESTLIVSGSDDGTIKVWDSRRRGHVHSLESKYQVTAVSFGMTDDTLFTGGIDNDIKMWDLRKLEVSTRLTGHTDTVTGLRLSADGKNLASNAMDNTVRVWDAQPFVAGARLKATLHGSQHNYEKNLIKVAWAPDNVHVAAGSADRNVYVWNSLTGRVMYCLPGHKGSVNDVDIHPKEPIVLSCSSDKRAFLGELRL
jgi:WD40 repeat protein